MINISFINKYGELLHSKSVDINNIDHWLTLLKDGSIHIGDNIYKYESSFFSLTNDELSIYLEEL